MNAISESDHVSVLAALNFIQEAQYTLDAACRKLCSVDGLGDQYAHVCKLSDAVKARWHEVNNARCNGISATRSVKRDMRRAAKAGAQ